MRFFTSRGVGFLAILIISASAVADGSDSAARERARDQYNQAAQLLRDGGENAKARQLLEGAMKEDPKYALPYFAAAKLALAESRDQEAARYFNDYLSRDPSSPYAETAKQELARLTAKPRPAGRKLKIGVMPRAQNNSYFIVAQVGALACAKELGDQVELIWDGPHSHSPAEQSQILNAWIDSGVDAIAIAPENAGALLPSLRKAKEKGIRIVTWDADIDETARDFYVNRASDEAIGTMLADNAATAMDSPGELAIIAESLDAAPSALWIKFIKGKLADRYPRITVVDVLACGGSQTKALDEATMLLKSHPDLKLLMTISSPALPAAVEAVKQSGRTEVKIVGMGLPTENMESLKNGSIHSLVLWKPADMGYLAARAAYNLAAGKLKPGDTTMDGGSLGKVDISGSTIMSSGPWTFIKWNADEFGSLSRVAAKAGDIAGPERRE